jgi:hypothetical protein
MVSAPIKNNIGQNKKFKKKMKHKVQAEKKKTPETYTHNLKNKKAY